MINSITIKNLKGKNATYRPLGMNVIVGPNWSGKTTILSAIRLGLLGYEPKLGKRPGDSFQLATGDEMEVLLELPALQVKRSWKLRKGKVSTDHEVPSSFEVPSLLLDISDWFAMTAQQRRDHLLASLTVNTEELDVKLLSGVRALKIDPAYPEHDEEKNDIAEEVEFWMAERDHNQQATAEWLTAQIAKLKERVTLKRTVDDQQTALLQTIAQERAAATTGTPADQEQVIQRLLVDRDEVLKKIGKAQQGATLAKQRREISAAIEALPKHLSDEKEKTEAEIVKLTERLNAISGSVKKRDEIRHRLNTAERGVALLIQQLTQIESETKRISARFAEQSSVDCCPTCGRKGTGKMGEKIKADYEAEMKRLTDDRAKVDSDRTALESVIAQLKISLNQFESDATDEAAAERSLAIARGGLQMIERDLADEQRLRNALDSLPAEVTVESDNDLQERLNGVNATISRARELQSRRALLLERGAQEALALNLRDAARRTKEIAELALKLFIDEQSKVVTDAFGPLVTSVRRFTDGLLSFELSHRDGDLGYVGPRGQWVSHKTFSGAEQAITYAGLGVALAAKSKVGLVLIDELLISAENKVKLTQRMNELIDQKVIQQCFVCDTSELHWPSAANVINV